MKNIDIPVGISNFAEIRKNKYYYIDKTGLIEELLKTTATKVTLITRPRRFGKTLGMSMLENFLTFGKTVNFFLTDWKLQISKRYVRNG